MAGGLFGGGNGSAATPFLIEDADDLNQVRGNPSAIYKLISNINLGAPPYNIGNGWTPIANFTGVLDGNGKTIYNLYINRPTESELGLFKTIVLANNAAVAAMRIKNLNLENVDITGSDYIGAIAGRFQFYYNAALSDARLQSVSVQGKIKGHQHLGGFFGQVYGTLGGTTRYAYTMAQNGYSEIVFTPIIDNKYIGQFAGSTRDTAAVPATLYDWYFNNCVGVGSVDTSIAAAVNKGNTVYSNYAYGSGSFQDITKWPIATFANTVAPTALATAALKLETNLSALTSVLTSDGLPMWSIIDGQYPKLWVQAPDFLFVHGDAGYYTYNVATASWVIQSTTEPTRQFAIEKGMRLLECVPQAAWDFFKTHNNPYIVNIMDKSDTISAYDTAISFTKDVVNSNEDKTIFRKTFTHNALVGSLSAINI